MDQRRTDFVMSFMANDESGKEYKLDMFQDVCITKTRGGVFETPTTKSLKWNGQDVNRIDQGKYEIVLLEIKLTSADPDAP